MATRDGEDQNGPAGKIVGQETSMACVGPAYGFNSPHGSPGLALFIAAQALVVKLRWKAISLVANCRLAMLPYFTYTSRSLHATPGRIACLFAALGQRLLSLGSALGQPCGGLDELIQDTGDVLDTRGYGWPRNFASSKHLQTDNQARPRFTKIKFEASRSNHEEDTCARTTVLGHILHFKINSKPLLSISALECSCAHGHGTGRRYERTCPRFLSSERGQHQSKGQRGPVCGQR